VSRNNTGKPWQQAEFDVVFDLAIPYLKRSAVVGIAQFSVGFGRIEQRGIPCAVILNSSGR